MKKQKEVYTPDFIQIPQIVMHLPPAERFVFGVVYFYAQLSDKMCRASNATIARVACISEGAVANCLVKLEEGGFIKRYFKDNEKRNRDYIVCLVKFTRVSPTDASTIHQVMNRDTSGDEQIKNIDKESILRIDDKSSADFNSKEFIDSWVDSKEEWKVVIGAYARRKKLWEKFTTKTQLNQFLYKNRKIGTEISAFSRKQISDSFTSCEDLVRTGKIKEWSLYTVKHLLLK